MYGVHCTMDDMCTFYTLILRKLTWSLMEDKCTMSLVKQPLSTSNKWMQATNSRTWIQPSFRITSWSLAGTSENPGKCGGEGGRMKLRTWNTHTQASEEKHWCIIYNLVREEIHRRKKHKIKEIIATDVYKIHFLVET